MKGKQPAAVQEEVEDEEVDDEEGEDEYAPPSRHQESQCADCVIDTWLKRSWVTNSSRYVELTVYQARF